MTLSETLQEWAIEKDNIHLLIRDNAANIKKAASDLQLSSESCFLHSLQLVVKISNIIFL